ncbi:hypothetical protein [Actinoplanes sp. NPDC049265]|uniref:hypothetical protein n=1 Tax=Actinoplanes sp. NPDC049265 TaxID=3363902 RepID=UPI00371FA92F
MRRLVLLLLLLPLAACSTGPAGGKTAAPATIPAPGASATVPPPSSTAPADTSGDAKLSQDTKAICAQADKLTTSFGATFSQDLKALIDSAQNAKQKAEVEQKTKRDVQNFSFALTDLSRLAADSDLKKALAGMGKEVTALKGDVRQLDAGQLGELSGKLDKACGRS